MEVLNILFMISHHLIIKLGADQIDNFKRMNVELQTTKLSKVGFK